MQRARNPAISTRHLSKATALKTTKMHLIRNDRILASPPTRSLKQTRPSLCCPRNQPLQSILSFPCPRHPTGSSPLTTRLLAASTRSKPSPEKASACSPRP
ncbi:hypothetical protein BC567DRAFT_221354 [Phyllosticta citribraziliensis]